MTWSVQVKLTAVESERFQRDFVFQDAISVMARQVAVDTETEEVDVVSDDGRVLRRVGRS